MVPMCGMGDVWERKDSGSGYAAVLRNKSVAESGIRHGRR